MQTSDELPSILDYMRGSRSTEVTVGIPYPYLPVLVLCDTGTNYVGFVTNLGKWRIYGSNKLIEDVVLKWKPISWD